MKSNQNSLERLFRSAARAPRRLPAEAPFSVESRVLAGFRQGSVVREESFSVLPLFRRGLAFACLAALAVIAVSYAGQPRSIDEATVLNLVTQINYLP